MPSIPARTLLVLSLGLALLGCAGPQHGAARGMAQQQQQQADARAAALASSGYQPAESASLTLGLQQWIVEGETLPVNLSFASSGRALPLIVYLPGLGETAQGGARWRQAWARAGYAVLSLQALDADARAWSSDLARAADFKGLARAHQQPALVRSRLQILDAALAEARRRAAAGDSLWSRVDFDRMAVAAYDLGSQAALAGSGRFRAALVLSPLVPSEDEIAALRGPLLAISSRRDGDPLGLLGSAAQRIQLFEQLPAGGKYLMNFGAATHAQLAGAVGHEEAELFGDGMGGGRQQPSGGGRRQRGGGGGQGGTGMHAQAPGLQANPAGGQEAAVAIEGISIAFLDAHLRGSAAAQAWLRHDAQTWLQGLAEWRQR
jgi:hypothetical protein